MSNIVSSRKTGGFLSKFRSRKHKSESPDPGSANEENVGMHPLTVSPGFSPTKRSQKRTTVDALQVTALHARGLVSADSNGFSDPFVEVKVPGSRRGEKFKSRIIKKTLNPTWDEDGFIKCPPGYCGDIEVSVYDWDKLSGNDYLGGCVLNLRDLAESEIEVTSLPAANHNESSVFEGRLLQAMNIPLENLRSDRSLVRAESERADSDAPFGTVSLTFRNVTIDLVKDKPVNTHRVTIDVFRARDLLPRRLTILDSGAEIGCADPKCVLRLGSKKDKKTRVIINKLSPIWRQRFQFITNFNQHSLASFNVYDHNHGLLGHASMDLYSLKDDEPHTHSLTLTNDEIDTPSLDHKSELDVIITRSELYRPAERLKPEDKKGCAAIVTVTVHCGDDLKAMDFGGKSDPFVTVEINNHTQRTSTRPKTLSPEWKEELEFRVDDIFDMVDIRVFDEDKGENSNNDFMGRIKLQVMKLYRTQKKRHKTDGGRVKYFLKDKSCTSRAQGFIELSINVEIISWKTAAKRIIRKPDPKFALEEKFKLAMLTANIARLSKLFSGILAGLTYIPRSWKWDNGVYRTCIFIVLWVYTLTYLKLWQVPLFWAFLMLKGLFFKKEKAFSNSILSGVISEAPVHPDGDEDDDEDGDFGDEDEEADSDDGQKPKQKEGKKKGLGAKISAIKEIGLKAQNTFGDIASQVERIQHFWSWEILDLNCLMAVLLLTITVLLTVVPLKPVILIWSVKKMYLKGGRKYGILEKKASTPSPIASYLSRFPDNVEMEQLNNNFSPVAPTKEASLKQAGKRVTSSSSADVIVAHTGDHLTTR